ncbi:unnamed protein product, partial [Iphiclides podalirius]
MASGAGRALSTPNSYCLIAEQLARRSPAAFHSLRQCDGRRLQAMVALRATDENRGASSPAHAARSGPRHRPLFDAQFGLSATSVHIFD